MKMSQLSGGFSLESHNTGKSKWKINDLTDRSLKLFGRSDFKIAQIKSVGLLGPEELKLEIAAYCVDALLDLVIQYYQEWQPKCLQKQWWAQIQKYYRRWQEFRYFSHI